MGGAFGGFLSSIFPQNVISEMEGFFDIKSQSTRVGREAKE